MKLPALAWHPPLATNRHVAFEVGSGVAGATGSICESVAKHTDGRTPPGWSRKRFLEHGTGRQLCKLAQRALLLPQIPLPRREDGPPRWPDGTCGSIAHTDTHAIAVLSCNTSIRALGVDLERADGVTPDLHGIILTPTEQASCPAHDPFYATRIFSAKEAVYKAVYPIEQKIFDFQDVTIEWSGPYFKAVASGSRGELMKDGVGVVAAVNGHVATLFVLAAASSAA